MIRKQLKVLSVFIAGILPVACESGDNHPEVQEKYTVNENFLKNIETVIVGTGSQVEELTLSGKVEYDPDRMVSYVPLAGGVVDRTYFSLGDKVKKGQTLLDFRSTELTALYTDLIAIKDEVSLAERELESVEAMYKDGMTAEKELLEAKARLSQARASYQRVERDMAVHGTKKTDGSFSIASPLSGYIVQKNVSSGSTVSADSDPLFMVADLSTVWIMANVYAGNLQFVKEGQEVEITALSYPNEIFTGKIDVLSQVFDPEEKVLKARIVMPNKDMKLKPEMAVVIKLKSEPGNNLISIPSDALVFDDDRYFVIVKQGETDFEIREVSLQGHYNKHTYIASGLLEGEEIVLKNQLLIYSGLSGK